VNSRIERPAWTPAAAPRSGGTTPPTAAGQGPGGRAGVCTVADRMAEAIGGEIADR
jgi:hypothetical protein